MRRLLSPFLVLVAALATPVHARNDEGDWEVGVHLGRTNFIDNDELDDETLWGVNAGYCFTRAFEAALNYDTMGPRSSSGAIRADLDILTADFLVNFPYDAHRPFFLLGIGTIGEHIREEMSPGVTVRTDRSGGVVDLGAGYRGYVTDHVGVRVEGRLFFTDHDGHGFGFSDRDLRISLGVAVSLRRK